jgi:hypothetical protein
MIWPKKYQNSSGFIALLPKTEMVFQNVKGNAKGINFNKFSTKQSKNRKFSSLHMSVSVSRGKKCQHMQTTMI